LRVTLFSWLDEGGAARRATQIPRLTGFGLTMAEGGPGTEFSGQLRAFRRAAGLTQETLSDRSGISVDAISALECGRRQRPHSYTVRALADALGLSAADRERLAAAARTRGSAGPGTGPPTASLPSSAERGESGPVRVAIVDDHPIARYGMEHVLASSPDVRLVLSSPDAGELVSTVQDCADPPADVVVMDLYLHGDRPSLRTLRDLATVFPVLVISASTRPADVLGAIMAGASGYLTKKAVARTFMAAVETVHSGGFWLSAELADIVRRQLVSGTYGFRAELSLDEDEILGYIARGLSPEQAARRMAISTTAVDLHIRQIRAKIGGGVYGTARGRPGRLG
jgi:DNA-binding NarL/FixJ family response regulator/transcriptional regulator with XRE-family HTH domain